MNRHPFLKSFGLAACVIVPIIVIMATSGADPEAAGKQAGALAVGPLLAGIVVGIWAKRAARPWRTPDYVWRFAVCTVVFAMLNDIGRGILSAADDSAPTESALTRPIGTPLTDDEKRYFDIKGGWADNAFFDFVMPVGDKFVLAPDIQSEMNRQLATETPTYAWAMQHENGHDIILVLVTKGTGDKKDDFRAFTRGIDKGIRPRATRVFENEFRWDRQMHEFRHGAQLSNGVYLRTRCLTSGPRRKEPYIVCAQALSPDSAALIKPLAFLEVRSWRVDLTP